MCGICGIMKSDGIEAEHVDIFNNIFEQSESRGSDAFGFYSHPKETLFKQKGKVTDFLKKHRINKLVEGNKVIVGHTRATTTGTEKNNQNNHPFSTKDFVMAHNGMIWNHEYFRDQFKTDIETDSIMILKLIQEEYDKSKNIANAISKMTEKLRGNYACWLLVKKTGSIYLFRHNNPIYLGYSMTKDMYAFASDKDFLSFMGGKIKEKLGFSIGLAYANIEEDTIYRLTDKGLANMGTFKPLEYIYTNQEYNTKWKGSNVSNYSNGKLDNKLTTEVTGRISFEDVLWNEHKLSFNLLSKRFEFNGINFTFMENWVEIKFDEESYSFLSDILESYGLTISPNTHVLRVEYQSLIKVIFDINEVLEEEF